MLTLGLNWGADASERAARMPCDGLVSGTCTRADRAIDIEAPPGVVFAWLCQLRVAPYSYDVLDNFGRCSPRRRASDLRDLEVGQPFMTFFRLASFVDGEQITLRTTKVAVTYRLRPQHGGTRLHARVLFEGPRWIGNLTAVGDVVMMRRQLLTLKSLAELEARSPRARRRPIADDDARLIRGDYDYADSFEIDFPADDHRTPEQAFRAALARGPAVLGLVPMVHRRMLRFRLAPLSSRGQVIGWRVVSSDPELLHLEARGPLVRGVIVGRRGRSTAMFTSFLVYAQPRRARLVWTLIGPLHRMIAPRLLELAVHPSAENEAGLLQLGRGQTQ